MCTIIAQKFLNIFIIFYKEWKPYFDGQATIEQVCEKIKQNTRIYSRKQTTWYRRDEEITWFHPDDTDKIINHIDNIIKNQRMRFVQFQEVPQEHQPL